MRLLLLQWLTTMLFVLPLAAADFCAVSVNIVGPGGEPASPTVALIAPDGTVVESVKAVNGQVDFCDFGFGEHTIRVGDQCAYVTLHGIKFLYGVSQHLAVVLNYCMMRGDGVRPPACLAYLRISSSDGKKLGAHATTEGNKRTLNADSYGRIFIGVPNGTSSDIKVSAPGYNGETVHVTCNSYETIEKNVKLTRQ